MEKSLKNSSAEVVVSCLSEKYLRNEVMLEDHCFVRIIAGGIKIVSSDTSQVFGPGDMILFPRRHLSTVIQYPEGGDPYKCILIMFKNERLKNYYAIHPTMPVEKPSPVVKSFQKHPLLENYFTSLMPYLGLQEELPESLLSLKMEEAILILRTIDVSVDAFLADFSEPGKIDLVSFMEQNFMINMSLDKFSYLTGRSLTTFKRDFAKIYGVTPRRWLTMKRLKLAHYVLSKSEKKPVDVYREVGFEDLSHFSYAFKKQFGYGPKKTNLHHAI